MNTSHSTTDSLDSLFEYCCLSSPPIDLWRLSKSLGVVDVQERPLSTAGMSYKSSGGGFVIVLNSRDTRARRRFTWAHEIGHIVLNRKSHLLGKRKRIRRLFSSDRFDEEKSCDTIASSILMPRTLFVPLLHRLEPSINGLRLLAKQFDVSISASAMKVAELSPHWAIIGWRYMPCPGAEEKLRVDWWAAPKGTFIPKFASITEKTIIHQSFRDEAKSSGIETLSIGSLRGSFWTENIGREDRVLSVVRLPNLDGQQLPLPLLFDSDPYGGNCNGYE